MHNGTSKEPVERLMYSVSDAARALGISDRSVYNRIYDGSLTTVRLGGRVLIPVAAVRALAGVA